MSETTNPFEDNEAPEELICRRHADQKRHDDLDFDEKKKYYDLRETWFPRIAFFIIGVVMLNYIIVFFSGMEWLNISPWVLQSLITESMIGILGLAGVMALYLYPPGKGIFKRYKLD